MPQDKDQESPTIFFAVKILEDGVQVKIARSRFYQQADLFLNEAKSYGKKAWVDLEDEAGNPHPCLKESEADPTPSFPEIYLLEASDVHDYHSSIWISLDAAIKAAKDLVDEYPYVTLWKSTGVTEDGQVRLVQVRIHWDEEEEDDE